MNTATISSKGQLVIPSELRRIAGIRAGDVLDIALEENGNLTLKKTRSLEELSEHFTGLIKPDTPPLEDTRSFYLEREERL